MKSKKEQCADDAIDILKAGEVKYCLTVFSDDDGPIRQVFGGTVTTDDIGGIATLLMQEIFGRVEKLTPKEGLN